MNLDVLTTDFVILSEGTSIAFPVAKRTANCGHRERAYPPWGEWTVVSTGALLQGGGKTVNITPFRPSQFAEGNRSRPQFEYAENQAKETA